MADESILSVLQSPSFLILIGIGALILFLFLFLGKGKKDDEFKPQKLKVTFREDLEKKINTIGIPFKTGTLKDIFKLLSLGLISNDTLLVRDFHTIAKLDKYAIIKMALPKYTFDKKTKDFLTLEENVDMELLVLRSHHPFFLFNLFGIGKKYYIFDMKSYNKLIKFDPIGNYVIIQGQSDITSYGDIFVMSESEIEYLGNVSIKRMVEQTNMWLENNPDRVVHLDTQQAKVERINRTIAEQERRKYEDRKNMGETEIT